MTRTNRFPLAVITAGTLAGLAFAVDTAFADDLAPPSPAPVVPGSAPAPSGARALVVHVPPLASMPNTPIELSAMIDAPFAETLDVQWRAVGEASWHELPFERSSAGGWYASIPGSRAPVEYFIRGRDAAGIEVSHFASAAAPHVVRVDPTAIDRLESLDRTRLDNHRNQVMLEVTGHNFGNRFELEDRFVRGELGFTHRLWRVLHHISFGFGSIGGKTPRISASDGVVETNNLRFGYGEVRVRAHRSVFLDARAALGVSHEGFDQGIRGQVTFGKPWRSCVQVGGEFFGDLGGSAWVRLQWDTAPPFLMGAAIMRTDLPGSTIDSSGLYLAYDVSYLIANTFTIKAQLSYGSRDGRANVGGGLGTGVDF
jgi:hypothetical protein